MMHPLVILVPVVGLIFAPRIWVKQVLKEHNRREDENFPTGGDFAKELLIRHQLQEVKVETSDIGDHYDPKAKAVRLTRDKFARKTLTAVTTAAHEVAHALQDASNYPPFVLRMRLVTLAQKTGQVGSVVLITVPALSIISRQSVPPVFIGATALAMIVTGMAAQLTALPTELDASFGRAMPLLKEKYISGSQAKDAQKILVASSLTYVASSLLSVLNIWPWLGWWTPIPVYGLQHGQLRRMETTSHPVFARPTTNARSSKVLSKGHIEPRRYGLLASLTRQVGKPLIRGWFQLARTF